jgi:hypothetical protein
MPKRSREKAGLIVQKRGNGGLYPVSAFDAERLDALKMGTEFNVTERTRRSLPQHRTYWLALTNVVAATDKWPTAEHLHRALKQSLGYVTVNHDLNGRPFIEVDSTAFDAMGQSEFQAYFDKAMPALAEAVGFDPLAFLEAA